MYVLVIVGGFLEFSAIWDIFMLDVQGKSIVRVYMAIVGAFILFLSYYCAKKSDFI